MPEKSKGEKLKFLYNPNTGEAHRVEGVSGSCQIGEIKSAVHYKRFTALKAEHPNADKCAFCFVVGSQE